MGGLGPTEDDLTREAVAEALKIGIKRNPDLIAQLYTRAAQRRMTMTRNNEKQADVIEGAVTAGESEWLGAGPMARHGFRRASQAGSAAAWASVGVEADVR